MATQTSNGAHRLRKELASLRDEIRLKLHLAGMEAKREWERLDPQVRRVEQVFSRSGTIAEATRRTAREVNHAIREMVEPRLPQPRIRDVMTESPVCCRANDSLATAAQIMWDHDCGVVPVIDGDGKAVGVITDRDICMAVCAGDATLDDRAVADSMSKRVVHRAPDDSLEAAAKAMMDNQIRRILVIDDDQLVGVLSLADLARHCHDPTLVADTLFAVSAPRL